MLARLSGEARSHVEVAERADAASAAGDLVALRDSLAADSARAAILRDCSSTRSDT